MSTWPGSPGNKATQVGFAAFVGISQPRVSQLVANGVLKRGGSYSAWLDAYLENLRNEKSGVAGQSLADARAEESRVSTQLKNLELAERLDKVIWTPDLEPVLQNLAQSVLSQVMGAGEKIIQGIETNYRIELDDEFVNGPLRTALSAVASGAAELVQGFAAQPAGVDPQGSNLN